MKLNFLLGCVSAFVLASSAFAAIEVVEKGDLRDSDKVVKVNGDVMPTLYQSPYRTDKWVFNETRREYTVADPHTYQVELELVNTSWIKAKITDIGTGESDSGILYENGSVGVGNEEHSCSFVFTPYKEKIGTFVVGVIFCKGSFIDITSLDQFTLQKGELIDIGGVLADKPYVTQYNDIATPYSSSMDFPIGTISCYESSSGRWLWVYKTKAGTPMKPLPNEYYSIGYTTLTALIRKMIEDGLWVAPNSASAGGVDEEAVNALIDAKLETKLAPEAFKQVAGDAMNTIYDEALGVTWKATMINGSLYYSAIVNEDATKIK